MRRGRKGFVKGVARVVVVLACVAGMVLGGPGGRAWAGETKDTVTIHGKTYGLAYVNRIMAKYRADDGRYRVTDFLKDNGIELLTVDTYKEKVYGSKKPVIVMPYYSKENAKKLGKINDAGMRNAIILKLLKEQFGDKVNFYAMSVYYNEQTGEENEERILFKEEVGRFLYYHKDIDAVKKQLKISFENGKEYLQWATSTPSLLLYSARDGLKKLDKIQLMSCQSSNVGYSLESLMRASLVVNCQLIFSLLLFLCFCQA